MNKRSQKC